MNRLTTLQLELESRRQELGGLLDSAEERGEDFDAKVSDAKAAVQTAQSLLQTAALVEPSEPEQRHDTNQTAEDRAFRELRAKADFTRYVAAAMGGFGVSNGPELELNQHLGIAENYFPLELLGGPLEERALRDGDAGATQGTWLDRVFHGTAAERVGISFRTVPPGLASYPITSAGGSPAQRGRTQAAAESTYTVDVTEIKPARRAVHGIYSIEDDMRLPGLASAIERDMAMAMVESVDRAVFDGDAGSNETTANIVGMKTAAITEFTISQTNKIKPDEILKSILAYIDGKYAASIADVRLVVSVGSNTVWYSTIHNSTADNQTIAQFLMASGLGWTTRGGIDANTANGDFGAYLGLSRGIEGAGIAAVWSQGQLVRDVYSGASSGEVQLTLNYLWQLAFPRTDNYKRLKYVA